MEEDWDTELLEQEAAAAPQQRSEEQAWMANSGIPNSPSLRFSSRPSSPLSGFPGRPNSPFFGFSQNKGSLGANAGPSRNLHMQRDIGGYSGSRDSVLCQNREDQPMTGFGRGRSSGGRDFQERNSTDDPGMQEQGFRGVPGIFGQSKCFNNEVGNSPLRGSPFAPGVRGAVGGSAGEVHKGRNEEIDSGRGPKVTYVPPPPPDDEQSIFACYQSGINFDKYDECAVEMSGLDPPTPLLAFEEANFSQTLRKNISKTGYSKLTPVQKYSIPVIQAGRDLMSCAQTGSGKTAAFLLPIVDQMMKDGITASVFQKQQEPQCIIVAPTRELINQIFLEARKFVYGTCIRPVVIYGGTQTGHSIRQIMQGCNILCATPGRLLDIIEKGKISLVEVKYLVLDEADRMLDMGFGLDMKKLISYPDMPSKDRRQTLMFSATFPEEVQRLAGEFLKTDYIFLVIGNTCGACSDVQQSILQVPRLSKRDKLIEILQSTGGERTMVFVDTKKKADYLAAFLCQENLPSTSIHGDREQREREIALHDFRSGKCQILVATSVAARGLDIENVQHVINFDLPNTIEDYVHRIGRTGRCGNTGKAVSFFDDQSDGHLVQSLLKVLSEAHQEVPVWLEEMAVRGTSVVTSLGAHRNTAGSSRMNPGEMRMSYSQRTFKSWE
ncbi:probable ATP-dependent RNA helicase DDX4 [Lagopus leucura]|uniref:probable ATP-dependent RNA helicase DDX4 n=1 Tax=Lagopus leucura TaxID=30410 RepID=UPI001C673B01|nr:probable ATP-dependent RNA helicase DDX4 [Lagopus leucura]